MTTPFTMGWLSTGRDEAARQLLDAVLKAIGRGQVAGRIGFVFSNREPGEDPETDRFLELVRRRRLPLIALSSRKFRQGWRGGEGWREGFDQEVLRLIGPRRPHIGVLAGYMLIVSPFLCRRLPLINLHPAAPGGPAGTWQEVVWQLMAARAPSSGAMMHLVTPELDQGPPVTYCTYPLRGGPFDRLWEGLGGGSWPELRDRYGEGHPLFRLIRQEGLKREFPLIVATLGILSRGGVKIEPGRVLNEAGNPLAGYDLTGEVEAALARSADAGERRG